MSKQKIRVASWVIACAIASSQATARELALAPHASLAPGIRLHPAADVYGALDADGLPAPSLTETVNFQTKTVRDSLGVCACDVDLDAGKAARQPLGETSLVAANGHRFAVSVVTFEYALKLFEYLREKMLEPTGYLIDGCHARAHQMSLFLEKRGVLTGKVMARGKFQVISDQLPKKAVTWSFHVAPFFVVQEGDQRGVWVLDPALFNEPVRVQTWLSLLMQHPKAELTEIFVTNRFVLHPNHRFKDITYWRSEDIKKAGLILRQARKAVREGTKVSQTQRRTSPVN